MTIQLIQEKAASAREQFASIPGLLQCSQSLKLLDEITSSRFEGYPEIVRWAICNTLCHTGDEEAFYSYCSAELGEDIPDEEWDLMDAAIFDLEQLLSDMAVGAGKSQEGINNLPITI
jgi:hypothetical protein